MLRELTFRKLVLCDMNKLTKRELMQKLKQTYTNTIIDNTYIIDVKKIEDVQPGKMQEIGVLFRVSFVCMVYKVDIGDVVNVKVINSSHMGTYCYDENVGKEVASFYLPSVQVQEEYAKVKVIGRRLYDGLLFLVQLEESPKNENYLDRDN